MDISNNEFVTQRKKHIMSKSLLDMSFTENQSITSSSSNLSMRSLPNTSDVDLSLVVEYKSQIEQLQIELESAHREIEKLNLENNALQKNLTNYEKTIKLYKKIGVTETVVQNITTPAAKRIKSMFKTYETPELSSPISLTASNDDLSLINKLDLENNTRKSLRNMSNKKRRKTRVYNDDSELLLKCSNNCMLKDTVPTQLSNNEIKTKEILKKEEELDLENEKSKIIILGEQQLAGMTSVMINMWKGQWNDKYNITGFIRPNAKSGDILSYCDNLRHFNDNDRVILSVGSNDSNPFEIDKELYTALEKLHSTKVFLVPVVSNATLNENIVNNHISSIVKLYPNCTLLKKPATTNKLSKLNLVNFVSKQVIHEITKLDYNNKYINNIYKCHKLNITRQFKKVESKTHKKGTIPYYFKSANLENMTNKNVSQNNICKYSKGTIPFYFKPIYNNNNACATSTQNDKEKTFFRS